MRFISRRDPIPTASKSMVFLTILYAAADFKEEGGEAART
jgi:hypothetical protein